MESCRKWFGIKRIEECGYQSKCNIDTLKIGDFRFDAIQVGPPIWTCGKFFLRSVESGGYD